MKHWKWKIVSAVAFKCKWPYHVFISITASMLADTVLNITIQIYTDHNENLYVTLKYGYSKFNKHIEDI